MIITGATATIDDLLNMKIDKNSILNDTILNDMKQYGDLSFPMDILNDIDITIDLTDCNNWNLAYMGTAITDAWKEVKKAWIALVTKLKFEFDKLKNLNIKKLLQDEWLKLKNAMIDLWQQIKEQFNNVILFFEANFKKIINFFKKLKKAVSKEERDKLKIKIKNELKLLGKEIYEMFGIYIIVDFIKGAWKIMKNLFGSRKNKMNESVNNSKDTEELLNDPDIKKSKHVGVLADIAIGLIQSFGIVLVIASAINDIVKAKRQANEDQLNNFVNSKKNEDEILKQLNTSDLSDLSQLENIIKDDTEQNNDKSIISICPVYDDSAATISLANNGIILEIGKDINNFNLLVDKNADIKLDDIIGYIDGKPIKSIIEGKVAYITDRHIVINKNINIDANGNINSEEVIKNINSLLGSVESDNKSSLKNEISEISEKMTNMNYIETLIKDYLFLIYKPIIYNRITNEYNNLSYCNIAHDELINAHTNIRNEFENDIQVFCGADNVKTYAENNNLNEFKNILLNKKYTFIDNIFNEIKLYENNMYNINKDDNFLMCDYYLSFILMEYDNNPYLDKLYNIISKFYINRHETENKNKNDLIDKFNDYLIKYNINKTFNSINDDIKNNNNENIKSYFKESLNHIENNDKNVNLLLNLYNLIVKIKNEEYGNNKISLKDLIYIESSELLTFIKEIKNEYESYKKVINDIESLYNFINWPKPIDAFINNKKYNHYLFIKSAKNVNINTPLCNDEFSGISNAQPNSLDYWIKYCAIASLQNCAMPVYWSTGIVVAGAPVPMPIILIPLTYIDGPISTVIGLGVCGISISPLLLVINMTDEIGAVLFAVNMVIETAKQMLIDLKDMQYQSLSLLCSPLIKTLNNKIKTTEDEIREIKRQIALYKNL